MASIDDLPGSGVYDSGSKGGLDQNVSTGPSITEGGSTGPSITGGGSTGPSIIEGGVNRSFYHRRRGQKPKKLQLKALDGAWIHHKNKKRKL